MAAALEQNPVTHRIELMRLQWKEHVDFPKVNFVRWLIEADELKMIQAFCDLEQGDMAALPDMFLTLKTNFSSSEEYGDALMQEWLARFEDKAQLEEAAKRGLRIDWNFTPYKKKGKHVFESIAEHLAVCFPDFTEHFCVYLNPAQCMSGKAFAQWIKNALVNLPKGIRLIVHDFIGNEVFNSLMERTTSVNLVANLNMGNALKELMDQQSNPNDYHAQFTKCILGMAEAAKQQDVSALNKQAELALYNAAKAKVAAMTVSGYMCWGMNLQLLKKYPESFKAYDDGIGFAQAAIEKEGDQTCIAALIQLHSFKAANFIHLKSYDEALDAYEAMSQLASTYQQPVMEMEACRLGALYAPKSSEKKKVIPFLTSAFQAGNKLPDETLRYTQFPVICKELYEMVSEIQPELGQAIHQKMTQLLHADWLKQVTNDYITDIHQMKENLK